MNRRSSYLIRSSLLAIVLVAFGLFVSRIEWSQTWTVIRSASLPVLAAAVVVNLLSLALKGIRWWLFLRSVGAPSFWLAQRAIFAGAALNNLFVANSGEAARVVYVARSAHVPSERVLATVALERLFELVGYVVLLALSISFLALPIALQELRWIAMGALVALLALLLFLLWHPERAELPALEGEGLLHRAREYGRGFLRTLKSLSTPLRFAVALFIAVIAWGLQVVTYALTARAVGFELSLVGTVAVLLAVNAGFAIRVTPGNIGVFQMVYAMTASAFGMDTEAALGVALLIQAQQILPVTLLGLLAAPDLLAERRRHSPRPDNLLPGEPPSTKESGGSAPARSSARSVLFPS